MATRWTPRLFLRRLLLAMAIVAMALCGACIFSTGSAQTRPVRSIPVPRADGKVLSFANAGSVLYLGGSFKTLGQRAIGQFAVVGRNFPVVLGGPVWDVASDGQDGWFVGGDFVSVGGVRCPRLAHLNADGTLDRRWCVAPDASVNVLTVAGDRLYVGGDFGRVARSKRPAVAVFDLAGAKLLPWKPSPFHTVGCGGGEEGAAGGASVWQIEASEAYVYIDGCLEGGTTGGDLELFDVVTGARRKWKLDVPEEKDWEAVVGSWALAPAEGTLYVDVESLEWPDEGSWPDVVRLRFAAVDAVTGKLKRWYPAPNGGFRIALSGSTLFLAGKFGRIGDEPRRNLGAVDASSGSVTGWNPDADSEVNLIVPAGATVFVAGLTLKQVGGAQRAGVAELDASTGQATSWQSDVNGGWVTGLAVSSSKDVALGFFEGGVSGAKRSGAAAINTSNGRVTAWNPALVFEGPLGGMASISGVDSIAVSGSTVYLAGNFVSVGGRPRSRLAAVDIRTGAVKPWYPKRDGLWEAIVVSGGVVCAGRLFGGEGDSGPLIAAFDAKTGKTLWTRRFQKESVSDVSMIVVGSTLFVGGEKLQAFDPKTGKAKRFPAIEGVTDLVAWQGTLYVATRFDFEVLALDAKSGRTKWRARRIDAAVLTMAVSPSGVLYLGGYFGKVEGQARHNLAALDAKTGKLKPWRAAIAGRVYEIEALQAVGSRLYVGGWFDGYVTSFPISK
jgi:hypothetical protein